jgi:hypothetical protein
VVKSLLSATFNTRATAASSTQYWVLGTGPLTGVTAANEPSVAIPYPAGTFSNLYLRVTASTTVNPIIFTVRKNGADTAMTITIPAGATGVFEDTTHSFSINAGDKVNYKTAASTTGTISISVMSIIFDATTNCVSKLVADGYPVATASVSRFTVISGAVSATSTSGTICNNTIRKIATVKNHSTYVSANARTTDTSFFIRKNTTNTAITIVYANIETGLKQDTTHTDTTTADDVLDYRIVTGAGTETLTVDFNAIELEHPTHGLISASSMGASADQIANFGETWYMAVGGSTQIFSSSINARQKARADFNISELTFRANVNTLDGATTLTLLKNNVDTALTVTMAAGSTTPVTDSTHTVAVSPTDEISLKLVTAGTTGAITIRQVALWSESVTITPPTGSGGGSQGRPPLYRTRRRRREPEIAIAIVRVRIPLEYEVEKLSIQVPLPYTFVPEKKLIKYASAILTPIARILPLPIRPTPEPPQIKTVRLSIPLTYEVTNLQLKAGAISCSYQVERLITQEEQHKIVATSINFLLSDF